MNRLQKPVWYFAGFGLAGLLSVLLLPLCGYILIFHDRVPFLRVGVMFGLCIGVCLYVYLNLHSFWKITLFISACAAAFYLAIFSGFFIYSHVHTFDSLNQGRWGPGPDVFFIAGWVGAFVVLTSAQLLLLPREKLWRLVGISAAWSLTGGLLGMLGHAANDLRTQLGAHVGWVNVYGGDMPLLTVWQIGVAMVLALMMQVKRNSLAIQQPDTTSAADSGRSLSVFGWIFFAVVFVLLLYSITWEIRGDHSPGVPGR